MAISNVMNKETSTPNIIKQIVTNTKLIIQQISQQDENTLVGIKDMAVVTASYRGVLSKVIGKMLDSPELIFKSILDGLKAQHNPQQRFARHFKSKKWQEAPFCYYRKHFENTYQQTAMSIEALPSLTLFEKQQALLFIRIFFEFIAPYNHICFHPELLSLTKKEKGKNLLRGLANFLQDLTLWHGYFNITSCPRDKYIVGKNIAYTPGNIIYQNELMELISYTPQTPDHKGVPLLLITSWINKYYIIDLKQQNSLVDWLAKLGFHVYTLSWNKPDKSFKDINFNDYVEKGVLTAITEITQYYPTKTLHLAGYCLGGTLAATAAAKLATTSPDTVLSLSLFASMIDFTNAGEMKKLLGDEQITAFENSMKGFGIWNGRKMAAAFNLMDPDCNLWLFYQRCYLQGDAPRANEIIHWGQDYTHTPEALFKFYMRGLYRDNVLPQTFNYSAINCPVYCLGLQLDDLTPKQAAFDTSKLFNNCHFVLGDSGHLVGLLSTPKQKRLGYYTAGNMSQNKIEAWQETASYTKGSWWLDWYEWVKPLMNTPVDYTINPKDILCPTPGTYVTKMIC